MITKRKLRYIELFAGSGGLSLGLDGAGFDLFFANELSPMAGETYAYNILGEDLSLLAENNKTAQKVYWINSQFKADQLKERLRENPFEFSKGNNPDINKDSDLEKKLLIGDIDDLLALFDKYPYLPDQIRKKDIDLLSGGPPCQGFSLAGKRIKNDKKNSLPWSFASIAGLLQPKIVLLENVRGITSAFKTDDGLSHYAWLEVAKAFALKGYVSVCMLLNSKYFDVPQNRPSVKTI